MFRSASLIDRNRAYRTRCRTFSAKICWKAFRTLRSFPFENTSQGSTLALASPLTRSRRVDGRACAVFVETVRTCRLRSSPPVNVRSRLAFFPSALDFRIAYPFVSGFAARSLAFCPLWTRFLTADRPTVPTLSIWCCLKLRFPICRIPFTKILTEGMPQHTARIGPVQIFSPSVPSVRGQGILAVGQRAELLRFQVYGPPSPQPPQKVPADLPLLASRSAGGCWFL